MVKAATRNALVHAASFHVKVRTVWTKRRSMSGTTLATLTVAFMLAINRKEAPLLRALVQTIRSHRYKSRRWAPVKPASSAVFQTHLSQEPDREPWSILRASIRARMFSQVSCRVRSWRTPCKNHRSLPYNAFGKALAPAGYLKQFAGTLRCYDEMLKHPPRISKHNPATVRSLSAQLGFRGLSWTVSICLNDLALELSEEFVKYDQHYRAAQLAGDGVAFRGEKLNWADVEKVRGEINSCGRLREYIGTVRRSEICHLICEARQFYCNAHRGLQGFFADDGEKRGLCEELAQWCLKNAM